MKQFKIGDKAKDMITGYEGIILVYCKYKYNADMVGMQKTTLNSNNLPDEFQWFDVARLEMVKEGAFSNQVVKLEECPFNFLDEVQDVFVKNVKGTVMGIYYYFTGCVRVEVISDKVDEKGNVIKYMIPTKEGKLIKKAKEEKPVKSTGGPMDHPKMY